MNFCPGPTPKVDELSEKTLILNRKTDGEPVRPFLRSIESRSIQGI